MSDVNMTYETLYEILRNEKNRDDIQALDPNFYEEVVNYLRKNKKILEDAILSNSSEEEKEAIIRQIKNIKMLIKEIYERREKKIIIMALNKSRTKSDSIETNNLLVQEKEIYERLSEIFDCFRDSILNRVLNYKVPIANSSTCEVDYQNQDENIINNNDSINIFRDPHGTNLLITGSECSEKKQFSEKQYQKKHTSIETHKTNVDLIQSQKEEQQIKPEVKTLKFKENVPKFIGTNFEVYGPFEPEDIAQLPSEFADVLIRKGKAEEI